MRLAARFCSLGLALFVLCSLKPLELDTPLPKEAGSWKQVPGQITLFLGEDSDHELLCFVAEGQEESVPFFLSLDKPKGKEEVEVFLQKCRGYLDQKGAAQGAVQGAFVAVGKSVVQQVQQWLGKHPSQGKENAPNLTGMLFGSPSLQLMEQPKTQTPSVQIAYGFQLPKVQTTRDLRRMWGVALIQRMTAQRLFKQKISCELPDFSTFLLPEKKMVYQIGASEVRGFLHGMQEIKQVGFTIEELTEAKQFFLTKVQTMQTEHPLKSMPIVASFHAEGFLRNVGLLSYAYFLESAPSLVDSITPVDIAISLNECYDPDKRRITLFVDSALSETLEMQVRKEIDESEKLHVERSSVPIATEMAQVLANPEQFYQLALTQTDRELIYKIIDTMARDNVIKLGLKRKSMQRKGKLVRHVHPLRFLGHIFADRHLHHCMREIHRSSFKWHGFVDGLSDRIKEEASRNNLLLYVPAFAQQVNGDEKKITHYIEKRDWEGLVKCLL